MKHPAITILRWGLAFVFFYAAVASLLGPQNWIGYLPGFLVAASPLPGRALLAVFSAYEIVLSAMLFAGRKLELAALLSAVTLAVITIFNLGILEVTFRDVGLIFAALALWELTRKVEEDENGVA